MALIWTFLVLWSLCAPIFAIYLSIFINSSLILVSCGVPIPLGSEGFVVVFYSTYILLITTGAHWWFRGNPLHLAIFAIGFTAILILIMGLIHLP